VNRLIKTLHAYGARNCHRIAIDPVTEFPVDYYLTSQMVKVLAADLRSQFDPRHPVAVELDHGLGLSLLDLALLEAGIAKLHLPPSMAAGQIASALAWGGAQAVYLNSTARLKLRAAVPIAPLSRGIAAIEFSSEPQGRIQQNRFAVSALIAVAETLLLTTKRSHFDRHLALLPGSPLLETVAGFFPTIFAAGTYVVPPLHRIGLENPARPDFAQLVNAITDLRITSIVADATLLSGLVSQLERQPDPMPLLARIVVSSGMPRTLLKRGQALGLPIQSIAEPVPLRSLEVGQVAGADR
jgi:hypothetical protein